MTRRRTDDADPYDPYNPYDTGRQRFAASGNDPYRRSDQGPAPRERFRDDRGPERRPDRDQDDRSPTRPPGRAATPPRYGSISPSDDLSWPGMEPAEAEWQPARPPRRAGDGRAAPAGVRRPAGDRYDPASEGRNPSDQQGSGRSSEPLDQWSDDLNYDVRANEPADHAPTDDWSGGWRASRGDERDSDRDPAGEAWDEPAPDGDPTDGWTGVEATDDAVVASLPADDPRAALFDAPERPPRRSSGPRDGVRPPLWGMSGYAWRFARRLTIARTNRLLRLGAGRVLPASSRARFEAMNLPQIEVDETLAQVRSLDDWAEAWTGTAQRFLGETRRGGDMTPADAARSRQLAALCYHVASFFAFGDERLARTSRSASTTLFAQSVGLLLPETRQVNVRWRAKTMPGYLTVPSWATGRRPLAVLLNGATTSREELILWSEEFLAQGLAVLALDTPGFGQGSALGTVSLDNDDIVDGIVELADADPGLDPTRISLVGLSLGGTMALRAAAGDRRVSAVVAVTPLHEPARWLGASSQVSLAQIVPLFGGYDQLADFVLGLDMASTLAATEAQVLVFGAGRDLVVPPPEASRLAAALGEQATLVWFEDAGHALFDAVPEWTREAAEWLAVVMDVADAPIFTDQRLTDEPERSDGSDDTGLEAGPMSGGAAQPDDVGWHDPGAGAEEVEAPPTTEPPARTAGWRQPFTRRSGAIRGEPESEGVSGMTSPPEPEPYGAGVFDAGQAEQRRSGQQRGYETGAFGPLGPAAARILADEPTPEPGSAEWGYEDGNPWTASDSGPAWSDAPPGRSAPSTARLWADGEPTLRPEPILGAAPAPTALPVDRTDRASPSSGPSGDAPPGSGDYLLSRSPAVGRGRISEPFPVAPSEATPPSDPGSQVETAGPDGAAVAGSGSGTTTPDEPTGSPDTARNGGFRPRMAGEADAPSEADESDTHAPFRPSSTRDD